MSQTSKNVLPLTRDVSGGCTTPLTLCLALQWLPHISHHASISANRPKCGGHGANTPSISHLYYWIFWLIFNCCSRADNATLERVWHKCYTTKYIVLCTISNVHFPPSRIAHKAKGMIFLRPKYLCGISFVIVIYSHVHRPYIILDSQIHSYINSSIMKFNF